VLIGAAAWHGLPQLPASLSLGMFETNFTGRVTRMVDGDTFWIDAAEVRIRVWGLNAPEWDRPGGSAATAELSRLIAGRTLTLRQRDIDQYGRIVGQCFLPDGRDITAAMIASGTAREFCRLGEPLPHLLRPARTGTCLARVRRADRGWRSAARSARPLP
jgi:endonuclease YncB( thermonuclease family)